MAAHGRGDRGRLSSPFPSSIVPSKITVHNLPRQVGYCSSTAPQRIIPLMPLIRDEAVVLARLDYSENSQILVLFTRSHGKVRAIGKGIRRGTRTRFAAGIDLLEVGAAVLSSRGERSGSLALLTEWKQTRAFSGIREQLRRLHSAQYIAEITSRLTEDWDPAPRVFDAFLRALAAISGTQEVLAEVVAFQHVLLDDIGALPRFDACVMCGREQNLTHFSSFEGGFVCRHCEPPQVEKRAVSPPTVALLQHFGRTHAPETSDAETESVEASTRVETRAQGYDRSRSQGENVPASRDPLAGPFSLLNYHISHLMGRQPVMAVHLVPTRVQRRVD